VLARALAGDDPRFSRCSAIYTSAVRERTAVLLLRLRYLLEEGGRQQFAEEVTLAAFTGRDSGTRWIEPFQESAFGLLRDAQPVANMTREERARQVAWALDTLTSDWHRAIVDDRVKVLTDAHDRLRRAIQGDALTVQPHLPPDIVGCYVLVPGRRSR
jgi:hypothetical protein